jgi:polyphosphate kinase 2
MTTGEAPAGCCGARPQTNATPMEETSTMKHKNSKKSSSKDKDDKQGGKKKLKRKEYEKQLLELQGELCALQEWVKATGQRIMIVFEGRDAAGKGGTIKAITERVSPRVFRVVALPAPTDREKSQMYVQRYMAHFPSAGEVIIWDRSWYNRAGVEPVMGFCTEAQHRRFLELAPKFEKHVVDNGIILVKFWLEVGDEEQERRFRARIEDPVRQWKLSAMDLPSRQRWYDYSRARDQMLDATDTEWAPWNIVRSDDKKRARLNVITHLLKQIPYEPIPRKKVKLPKRDMKRAYDDEASMANRRWIPEVF